MEYNIKRKIIGIITFHRAINYGALLQTYALQKFLKKNECDCRVIDYRCDILESLHKKQHFKDCSGIIDKIRFVFYAKHYNQKFDKFRTFLNNNIDLSREYTKDQLLNIESEFDNFITGSDQVWNCNITSFDKTYFLDFVSDNYKKNSYAASFGLKEIPQNFVNDYRILLSSFNNISVREIHGVKIINEMIKKEVEVVLDPTLLLTRQEWEEIAKDYKKKKNYILLYMFDKSTSINKFVERLSKQTGCEVVYISHSIIKRVNALYERNVGPEEFVGLFKSARYVVTNSFHGTVFSIIFNKDFFVELLPEKYGVNSRIENLLELFDLKSRQIIEGKNDQWTEKVDYDNLMKRLIIERQKSIDYLMKIFRS